jgi:hypothetical protein
LKFRNYAIILTSLFILVLASLSIALINGLIINPDDKVVRICSIPSAYGNIYAYNKFFSILKLINFFSTFNYLFPCISHSLSFVLNFFAYAIAKTKFNQSGFSNNFFKHEIQRIKYKAFSVMLKKSSCELWGRCQGCVGTGSMAGTGAAGYGTGTAKWPEL